MTTTEQLPTTQSEEKTSTALAKIGMGPGAKISAFVPTTLDETWRLSTIMAKSGMAPKAYKTPEQIMVGIMAGMELGLTPFTSLQSIAVIGNNPTVWGDGALALVEASGLLEWHREEFDDATKTATCTVKRLGKPTPTARTFSFEDATKANLLNKEGPWRGYPKRMCQMRARAFALRDTFADVLKGMGIAEEVRDWAEPGTTRVHSENRLSAAMLFQQAEPAGEVVDGEATDRPQTIAEALDDEIPVHAGGNPFAEGEPSAEGNPWDELVATTRERIAKAGTVIDLGKVETEFLQHAEALPDEVVAEVTGAIAARREALKGGAK